MPIVVTDLSTETVKLTTSPTRIRVSLFNVRVIVMFLRVNSTLSEIALPYLESKKVALAT